MCPNTSIGGSVHPCHIFFPVFVKSSSLIYLYCIRHVVKSFRYLNRAETSFQSPSHVICSTPRPGALESRVLRETMHKLMDYRTNDITVRGAAKIANTPTCSPNGYYHTENKDGAQ